MMQKPIMWKLALIVGAVGLSVWLFYPPKQTISLGLDLQGGSHLVLQVETSAAVKSEIDLAINRIGQMLKEKGIPYTAVTAAGTARASTSRGPTRAVPRTCREILDTIVPELERHAVPRPTGRSGSRTRSGSRSRRCRSRRR